jgi:hypothetical protein
MVGRIHVAAAGSDFAAIWYSIHGPRAKLDELERAHGTARLIWSTPGSRQDEATVHATLSKHRVGDHVFRMTADQIASLIEDIKNSADRQRQKRQAAFWIKRGAATAAEALQLEREENDPVDTRTLEQQNEEERRAEEAANAAETQDLEHAEYTIARLLFGCPDYSPGGVQAVDPADLMQIFDGIRARGITSLRGIAAELNAQGIPTVRGNGKKWHASGVKRFLERASATHGMTQE